MTSKDRTLNAELIHENLKRFAEKTFGEGSKEHKRAMKMTILDAAACSENIAFIAGRLGSPQGKTIELIIHAAELEAFPKNFQTLHEEQYCADKNGAYPSTVRMMTQPGYPGDNHRVMPDGSVQARLPACLPEWRKKALEKQISIMKEKGIQHLEELSRGPHWTEPAGNEAWNEITYARMSLAMTGEDRMSILEGMLEFTMHPLYEKDLPEEFVQKHKDKLVD